MQRPNTAERLNHAGPPTTPRPSASVIVLRDGDPGLELLLVRRNPQARFMGGYWVFPGGAMDEAEGNRAAAVRELEEEAAVSGVDPSELVPFSRWITPELIQMRFDTTFFCVRAPGGVEGAPDGVECVDLRWITPRAALDAYAAGELAIVLPTMRQLEQLSGFATVDELLAHARGLDVVAVLPRVVISGDTAHVLLPGEPGYAED